MAEEFFWMIVRSWRAFAHSGAADQYPRHLLEVVKPRLERLTGFRGLYLLRRKDGDEVEYVVQTLWDSRAASRLSPVRGSRKQWSNRKRPQRWCDMTGT